MVRLFLRDANTLPQSETEEYLREGGFLWLMAPRQTYTKGDKGNHPSGTPLSVVYAEPDGVTWFSSLYSGHERPSSGIACFLSYDDDEPEELSQLFKKAAATEGVYAGAFPYLRITGKTNIPFHPQLARWAAHAAFNSMPVLTDDGYLVTDHCKNAPYYSGFYDPTSFFFLLHFRRANPLAKTLYPQLDAGRVHDYFIDEMDGDLDDVAEREDLIKEIFGDASFSDVVHCMKDIARFWELRFSCEGPFQGFPPDTINPLLLDPASHKRRRTQ